MTALERTIHPTETPRMGGGATPTGASFPANLPANQSFWDAADEAIERVLSSDSEAFLAATRQEGGQ